VRLAEIAAGSSRTPRVTKFKRTLFPSTRIVFKKSSVPEGPVTVADHPHLVIEVHRLAPLYTAFEVPMMVAMKPGYRTDEQRGGPQTPGPFLAIHKGTGESQRELRTTEIVPIAAFSRSASHSGSVAGPQLICKPSPLLTSLTETVRQTEMALGCRKQSTELFPKPESQVSTSAVQSFTAKNHPPKCRFWAGPFD
jgi:hypothetical protein